MHEQMGVSAWRRRIPRSAFGGISIRRSMHERGLGIIILRRFAAAG
jgi:hypothetical protein